jgi:hypothetical protein
MAVRAIDGTRSGGRGSATWLALTVALLLTGLALMAVSPRTVLAQTAPVYTQAAHSGNYYGATSTTRNGGGAYEDVAMKTSPGQVVCGSAWVRTEGAATGANGSFVLWLIGGTSDQGKAVYSGLGNGSDWTELHACVEATQSHTALRIQFYPNPGSPTVEIDDVDVHASLAPNGGFEYGSGPWGTYPNTNSSYDVYATNQVTGPSPPVITTPVPTPVPVPRAVTRSRSSCISAGPGGTPSRAWTGPRPAAFRAALGWRCSAGGGAVPATRRCRRPVPATSAGCSSDCGVDATGPGTCCGSP